MYRWAIPIMFITSRTILALILIPTLLYHYVGLHQKTTLLMFLHYFMRYVSYIPSCRLSTRRSEKPRQLQRSQSPRSNHVGEDDGWCLCPVMATITRRKCDDVLHCLCIPNGCLIHPAVKILLYVVDRFLTLLLPPSSLLHSAILCGKPTPSSGSMGSTTASFCSLKPEAAA